MVVLSVLHLNVRSTYLIYIFHQSVLIQPNLNISTYWFISFV
jgi:hypothetical protein